jgi:hypothetical protein
MRRVFRAEAELRGMAGSFADRRVGARWVVRIQRDGEEREMSFVIAPPAETVS